VTASSNCDSSGHFANYVVLLEQIVGNNIIYRIWNVHASGWFKECAIAAPKIVEFAHLSSIGEKIWMLT